MNRKGQVVDFLCERLGIDAETVKLPEPVTPAPAPEADGEARARAALLAAAGGGAKGEAAAGAAALGNATAMRQALEKLKSNPEAFKGFEAAHVWRRPWNKPRR